MRATTVFLTFVLTVFIVAACGGSGDDGTPPPSIIVPTATPRSTPLPPVNTPAIYGSADVPLRVLYVSSAEADLLTDAELSVATAINTDLTNERLAALDLMMTVQFERADTMQAVLDAVCLQRDVLAWVDAFTYVAAAERCDAQPLLGIQQAIEIEGLPDGVSAQTRDGIAFDIVYRADLPTPPESLAGVVGLTACRLSATDPISWIYFSLALQAEGVNPVVALTGFEDVENYSAMLEALSDGNCDLGAIPADTLSGLVRETDGVNTSDIETFSAVWPTVPHGVLIAPPEGNIPPDVVESFITQLQALTDDDDFRDALQIVVPFDQFVAVQVSDFRAFVRWLDDAGWMMGR